MSLQKDITDVEIISWLYTNFVYRDKMVISRQYEEPQMCCVWYINLEIKERKKSEILVLSVLLYLEIQIFEM